MKHSLKIILFLFMVEMSFAMHSLAKDNVICCIPRIYWLNEQAERLLDKDPNQSIAYAMEAMDSIRIYNYGLNSIVIANLNSTIGNAYYLLNDYKNAAKYLEKEFSIIEKNGDSLQLLTSLYNLGTIYKKLESNRKSLKFYLKSIDLAEKTNSYDILINNYQALYEVYEAMKDHKRALEYFRLSNELRDSLMISETKKEIKILRSNYKKAVTKTQLQKNELDKTNHILKLVNNERDALLVDSLIKANQILLLEQLNEEKENKLKGELIINQQQSKILMLIVLVLVFLTAFSVLLLFFYGQKRRAYRQLQTDALLIEQQHKEIEDKRNQLLLINNELKDSNATKDKFLSIIAHDLRNPFQSILGLSSLLKGNIDSTSKDDQILYLTHIINSTKKCNDLLTGLLDWAMTKSGKMKTKPVSINVEELVKSAVDEVNSSLTIKKIDIQIDIHRDLNFLADRTMLSVVLRNLLSNAIKFSMQGSQIFVYTEKENNFFHILIKDKGIGIPPDLIDKIFDIGENTSRRGTDNEQGTGLGLMLAKEFVAKNSGYISVDSKVGNGSVFKLTFPIHSV